VDIAVNTLTRNIARADFIIKKRGNDIMSGPLYDLFRMPNTRLSRYDLWKEGMNALHSEWAMPHPRKRSVVFVQRSPPHKQKP
jgi:hypothetical protein